MSKTSIEWVRNPDGSKGETWNPTTGCSKISPGCKHCYAETMAKRLQAMGQANYRDGFKVTLQPHMLSIPLRRRKPTMYFVNSISDLFHDSVPDDYIAAVFGVMAACPQHTFQVLTKRPERMREWFAACARDYLDARFRCILDADILLDSDIEAGSGPWPLPNVWLGVSVENRKHGLPRIDVLRDIPAAVRFLSVEPLLEDLGHVDLSGVDWVIVGGESGRGARPMQPDWVRNIRDQVLALRAPHGPTFFFKQWGAWCDPYQLPDESYRDIEGGNHSEILNDDGPILVGKHLAGRMLDGRTWDEMPR
jgi:protein gp37